MRGLWLFQEYFKQNLLDGVDRKRREFPADHYAVMSLKYFTFNQDYSTVAIATRKGFFTYSTEPFAAIYRFRDAQVTKVEVLFSTSLHALVLSPRLLRILNTKKGATICDLSFPTSIVAVKMNRKRLMVVLSETIYLYDISNMKLLHTIQTPSNPHALCALSASSDNNFLVYPSPLLAARTSTGKQPSHVPPGSASYHNMQSNSTGDVRVFNATTLEAVNTIQAHQSSIGCLSLNQDATMLATASEKGTVIRVFSCPDGQNLFQFRRGSLPAHVFYISFNATSTLLCVSSASETVHIFRLLNPSKDSPPTTPTDQDAPTQTRRWSSGSRERSGSPSDDDSKDSMAIDASHPPLDRRSSSFASGFASMVRQTSRSVGMGVATRVSGYLPTSITQAMEPQRDFAHVKVPKLTGQSRDHPIGSIVAMSAHRPQLFVVTSEGIFATFDIDLENGGEGVLVQQNSLMDANGLGSTVDD